jgi:ATP-dependent Clp protease ATP-binding subunit ClpB
MSDPDMRGEMEEKVMGTLRAHFRPEFLNRVDNTIIFHSLTMDEVSQIVRIQLGNLNRLLQSRGIAMELSEQALDFLSIAGFDPVYGARPLKRAIQQNLQDPMAMHILEGKFGEGDTVIVDIADGKLVFS